MTPKDCPRCREKVGSTMMYCPRCAMLLNEQMAMEEAFYGKIDGTAAEKSMDAIQSGLNIDMRLLAKMVAEEIKGAG